MPSRENPERFPVTFYVVAMLFVMFDIELIFIYPFAVDRVYLGALLTGLDAADPRLADPWLLEAHEQQLRAVTSE